MAAAPRPAAGPVAFCLPLDLPRLHGALTPTFPCSSKPDSTLSAPRWVPLRKAAPSPGPGCPRGGRRLTRSAGWSPLRKGSTYRAAGRSPLRTGRHTRGAGNCASSRPPAGGPDSRRTGLGLRARPATVVACRAVPPQTPSGVPPAPLKNMAPPCVRALRARKDGAPPRARAPRARVRRGARPGGQPPVGRPGGEAAVSGAVRGDGAALRDGRGRHAEQRPPDPGHRPRQHKGPQPRRTPGGRPVAPRAPAAPRRPAPAPAADCGAYRVCSTAVASAPAAAAASPVSSPLPHQPGHRPPRGLRVVGEDAVVPPGVDHLAPRGQREPLRLVPAAAEPPAAHPGPPQRRRRRDQQHQQRDQRDERRPCRRRSRRRRSRRPRPPRPGRSRPARAPGSPGRSSAWRTDRSTGSPGCPWAPGPAGCRRRRPGRSGCRRGRCRGTASARTGSTRSPGSTARARRARPSAPPSSCRSAPGVPGVKPIATRAGMSRVRAIAAMVKAKWTQKPCLVWRKRAIASTPVPALAWVL